MRAITREIFTQRRCGSFHLPHLVIPRWTRQAPQIQEEIARAWSLDVILIDFLIPPRGDDTLVLAELRGSGDSANLREPYVWTELDNISDSEMEDAERAIVRSLLNDGSTGRGALSRIGWVDEVLKWTASTIDNQQRDIEPRVRQIKVGPTTALLRLDYKNGRRYWFKAAGSNKNNEYGIVAALSKIAPEYGPEILGFHSLWKAWLTKDAGQELTQTHSFLAPDSIGARLAEFQLSTAPHADRLLDAGCGDHRPAALFRRIPILVSRLKEAMSETRIDKFRVVSDMRLDEIGESLSNIYFQLAALRIPTTLIHNDISPDNILIQSNNIVFIDWEAGAVGFPFVTIQSLQTQLSQENVSAAWLLRFNATYRERWRGHLDGEAMYVVSRYLPVLTVISYAWSRSEWLLGSQRHLPESNAQARALARRLDRLAWDLPWPRGSSARRAATPKRRVAPPTVCS